MIYVQLVSETEINLDAPTSAIIDGRCVMGELPQDYMAGIGWYPLDQSARPDTIPAEGMRWEPRYAYDNADHPTSVVQSWIEVSDLHHSRTFSKLKLKEAIASRGLLPSFKSILLRNEVAPGYTAEEAFSDAVNLSEAHPKFGDMVRKITDALGVPEATIEDILSEATLNA